MSTLNLTDVDLGDGLDDSLRAIGQTTASRSKGRLAWVYVQCYFVTIATVLGTGVLGLPVTLSESGLYPFLISFIVGFIMQALLIVFFTELLQLAYAAQVATKTSQQQNAGPGTVSSDAIQLDEFDDTIDDEEPMLAGHVIIPDDKEIQSPDLHMLGQLFLPCGLRQVFDLVLLANFVSILISYSLAGSEAYAQVLGIEHFYVIPVFVWVLTFLILFAQVLIQPVVSVFTLVKGSMLVATVSVTFLVSSEISRPITNNFRAIGEPFLMGTVALGGIINVMPMLYSRISPLRNQVRAFRRSVVSGLATCAILNILWCWAVLKIVPQLSQCFVKESLAFDKLGSNSSTLTTVTTADNSVDPITLSTQSCDHYSASLHNAKQNGEISTIPLADIIHEEYPYYDWIAVLVNLFIVISITVSYLTLGSALFHTLCGWADSVWTTKSDRFLKYLTPRRSTRNRFSCCNAKCVCQRAMGLVVFIIVFVISILNPKGFVTILDKMTSMALNVEAGIFVFLMLLKTRRQPFINLCIPVRLSPYLVPLHYVLSAYFCFAVGYDFYISIYETIH